MRVFIIFYGLLLSAFPSFGQQEFGEPNLREDCRRKVSGIYLNQLDGKETSTAMIAQMQKQLLRLKDKHIEVSKKKEQAYQTMQQNSYDLQLSYVYQGYVDQLINVETAQTEGAATLSKNEQLLTSYIAQEKFLQQHLSGVFAFVKSTEVNKGYKVSLEFKEQCPKYRYSCPLSAAVAKQLQALQHRNFQLPLACERYSTYLQGTPAP